MADKPKEYTIRSLRDIFELPTEDIVERCLKELVTTMLVLRNTAKSLNEIDQSIAKKEKREPIPLKWIWPDEIVWRDENGGTTDLHLKVNGKEILKMEIQHKKHRKKKE